jgi:hypothetical protein
MNNVHASAFELVSEGDGHKPRLEGHPLVTLITGVLGRWQSGLDPDRLGTRGRRSRCWGGPDLAPTRSPLGPWRERGGVRPLFSRWEIERRLTDQIEAVRSESEVEMASEDVQDDLSERFEAVVALLRSLDLANLWAAADEAERRVLVDELVESVTVWKDHLSVVVAGAPPLNVTLEEVGLKSQIVGVGGGT